MEFDRTASAQTQSPRGQAWASTGERPGCANGHRLRSAKRHSLEPTSTGDGLRFGRHLLAAAANLATSWHLEEVAGGHAPESADGVRDRPLQSRAGQPVDSRCFWGALTGRNPTDRAKKGTKRHLLVDRRGIPLALRITGANRHDSTQAMALIDAIPPIRCRGRGRPRRKPRDVYGDRAYGTPVNHRGLRRRHIKDHLAAPQIGRA